MVERNFPVNPQCEARIMNRAITNPANIVEAVLTCGTIFCKEDIHGSAFAFGETRNEAELKAEFTMRDVVRNFCPKWQALKNAGMAPENEELPDEYMPPFSE